MQFVVFEKLTSAYIFNIAREKSFDYVLIIYMKKYKIAYHNYAEAKCTSSAKITFFKSGYYSNPASDIVLSVKTTMYNQHNNIQCYFHISLVCYFFALN